ncbi:MAG TPA: hypothetical protein VM889_02010 [Candidatus Thermoplasmatota archaeon]|nr:hypothetical protein [Candidatus Thermoplasmatota archaeon]
MPGRAKRTAKISKKAKTAGRKTAIDDGRLEVRNVNVPGRVVRLDATKFKAIEKALLASLPRKAPGLTQAAMMEAVAARAPAALFPGGEKVGWWTKSAQLDLEARGRVKRLPTKPLTWVRN